MITARTKRQLLIFVIITLVGVSYVGAKYARLDRLVYDSSYHVDAHFKQSGGIFTGAEVTYRGVNIGRVSNMKLTRDGVDVVLNIDKSHDKIPSRTRATVGNKSAVGEQYVDLAPETDSGPYLKDGSVIEPGQTGVPVATAELLTNVDGLVRSVPQDQLRTVVSELGAGFQGTGPALGQILDTTASFVKTADDNFEVTRELIRDSNTVLGTQADKASAIQSFSRDLALFSGTMVKSDRDLRAVIDNGSATAIELRTFLEQNEVDLGELIRNLLITGQVTNKNIDGVRTALIAFPYLVAGGFTVATSEHDGNGNRLPVDVQLGLQLQDQSNPPCVPGYPSGAPKPQRDPADKSEIPLDATAHCALGPEQTNPRGAQNAPGTGVAYRAPVASYDLRTGKVTWADQDGRMPVVYDGGAEKLFGKDSWKQLLLGPAVAQ